MKFCGILCIIIAITSCASKKVDEDSPAVRKAKIYYNKGTNDLVNKNYTVALKHLLEAHALNPEDSKICNNLGMAYFFKKRPETAVRYIKRSIKLDTKNTDARINLATIYMNMNKYDLAEKQFNIVLDDLTYQAQYKTYYNLAVLNFKKNKRAKAITFLKQSLNENSQFCPAHYKMGEIFFNEGEFTQALDKFKSASMGVCYDNPQPLFKQALTYIELKDYGTAKLKLDEVIERFSLTKFERMAKRKLKALNVMRNTEALNF